MGVHIADVSYFVEEDNNLDAIASHRATSVYMVQKVSAPWDFLFLKWATSHGAILETISCSDQILLH